MRNPSATALSGQTVFSGQVFELPENTLNAVWRVQLQIGKKATG